MDAFLHLGPPYKIGEMPSTSGLTAETLDQSRVFLCLLPRSSQSQSVVLNPLAVAYLGQEKGGGECGEGDHGR